ncbi:MAG: hypothetical protein ACRDT2_17655 [Natronosporangium sp.]
MTGETWLILAVLAGLWLLSCAIWPYTACGRCSGGKRHSPSGEAWRNCRSCRGSGKKIRPGRRLLGPTDHL